MRASRFCVIQLIHARRKGRWAVKCITKCIVYVQKYRETLRRFICYKMAYSKQNKKKSHLGRIASNCFVKCVKLPNERDPLWRSCDALDELYSLVCAFASCKSIDLHTKLFAITFGTLRSAIECRQIVIIEIQLFA